MKRFIWANSCCHETPFLHIKPASSPSLPTMDARGHAACAEAREALSALREAASHPVTGRLHADLDMEALVRIASRFLSAFPEALAQAGRAGSLPLVEEARRVLRWCESERIRDGSIRRRQLPMLPGIALGSVMWQIGAACRLLAHAGEDARGAGEDDFRRLWHGAPWERLPRLRCLCLCPVNRPPGELTVAELLACWRTVSEPLYARPRVVTILATNGEDRHRDAPLVDSAGKQLAQYLRALELRACELGLGLAFADGRAVPEACYDHAKYVESVEQRTPNRRCTSVFSGFSTLLRQHSLVCKTLRCEAGAAPPLSDVRHGLLNLASMRRTRDWCGSAVVDWRSKAACDHLHLRCRRSLAAETDWGEAHARAGDVSESDRLQLLRIARQETSGALLGMDIRPHIGASPRLRKLNQMYWTDVAFRGIVTRGLCGLYGVFLLPADCAYAGRAPLHAYPYVVDTEEEDCVLLCHPDETAERVVNFVEALTRWTYEMCTEYRGRVCLGGITFSLLEFGEHIFPGITHILEEVI